MLSENESNNMSLWAANKYPFIEPDVYSQGTIEYVAAADAAVTQLATEAIDWTEGKPTETGLKCQNYPLTQGKG